MNLNFWELDHIQESDDSHHSDSNTSQISKVSNKKSDVEAINFQGQENLKIRKLTRKGKNQLKNFSDQSDEELAIILLQNINFSKKKFNFSVFQKNNRKNSFSHQNSVGEVIDNKINNIKESTKVIGLGENILKNINLHLHGDIESLTKPDQYREIVKDKHKKENKYRGEYKIN
jgi:hypothetical protein